MNDDAKSPVVSQLVFPILLKPIMHKLDKKQHTVAKHLLTALAKAEHLSPGILLELVSGICKKAEVSVSVSESLLRLQGTIPEFEDQCVKRPEEPFQDLNRKCTALKKILSRIPDEINHRSAFLETIKEIAGAIKKLLDCVNEISGYIPMPSDRQAVEMRKREFIRPLEEVQQYIEGIFQGRTNSNSIRKCYASYPPNQCCASRHSQQV
ncbi:Programmed cell death protein 10-B [Halotydeus destructor]|nr:Programmed cell death protein 10-B [Halotydeus destructor]